MREFILRALKAHTSSFNVDNLEDARFPPKLISFQGSKLRGFAFDELGISKFINHCLEKGENLKLNESLEVFPGIVISKKSFEQFVREKSSNTQIIYLHKKGKNIREFKFKENILFVFGDYIGMPRKTEFLLERINAEKVSLGKIEYHASQCIT